MVMLQERVCLECGKPLRGRRDQKFCSDGCRTRFHNRENGKDSFRFAAIDFMLKGNRSLLNGLLVGREELQLPREALLQHGFNPNFHTHRSSSEAHPLVLGVYEFSVFWREDQVLISRKPMVEQPMVSFQSL
jgi:predicted nucleic acid-binding Zn ribbon protein